MPSVSLKKWKEGTKQSRAGSYAQSRSTCFYTVTLPIQISDMRSTATAYSLTKLCASKTVYLLGLLGSLRKSEVSCGSLVASV